MTISLVHPVYEKSCSWHLHVTVRMETVPVNVTNKHNGSLRFESEKPLVLTPDDKFLLMDLNAKKLHIIGHGKAITSS